MCLLSCPREEWYAWFQPVLHKKITVHLRLCCRQTRNRACGHDHNTICHSGTHNAAGNLRSFRCSVRGVVDCSCSEHPLSQVPNQALKRSQALVHSTSALQDKDHLLRPNLQSHRPRTESHDFALLQAQGLHRLLRPKGLPAALA